MCTSASAHPHVYIHIQLTSLSGPLFDYIRMIESIFLANHCAVSAMPYVHRTDQLKKLRNRVFRYSDPIFESTCFERRSLCSNSSIQTMLFPYMMPESSLQANNPCAVFPYRRFSLLCSHGLTAPIMEDFLIRAGV